MSDDISMPAITRHPGETRGETKLDWLHSRHSFSFGHFQDPQRMNFRALRVINDDVVAPGGGFGEHGHRDMEILTWVLSGALKHGDSLGNMRELKPGELQAMTAGTGIRHSEFNASDDEPVHFLQIWILPGREGAPPGYLQQGFDAAGRANQWQMLAAGPGHDADGALPIDQDAAMAIATLDEGAQVAITADQGRHAYVHVATGALEVAGEMYHAGDAFSFAGPGEVTIRGQETGQVLWFDLG